MTVYIPKMFFFLQVSSISADEETALTSNLIFIESLIVDITEALAEMKLSFEELTGNQVNTN